MPEEILTVRDVAAYLKLDERTIYNLANQKKLPAIKLGKQWRFKKSDIDELFEAGALPQ